MTTATMGVSSVDRLARSKRPTVERTEIHIPPAPVFPLEAVTGDPRMRAQAVAAFNNALQKWRNDAWSIEAPFVPDAELQADVATLEDTTSKMSTKLDRAAVDIRRSEANITTISSNITSIDNSITVIEGNAITGTGIVQANGANPPTAILGTPGHVLYWTSVGPPYISLTSPIYTDGTSVGIGTDLPAVLLDLGLAGVTSGVMRLAGGISGNVTITTAATTGMWTLTLPTTDGNAGEALITDGGGITSWAVPVGAAHAMLSASHTDSTASAVSRGSLIVGIGASPTWAELNIGLTAQYLRSNGTDAAWSNLLAVEITGILPISNGGTNTSSFTSGRVIYYDGTSLADDDGLTYNSTTNSLNLGVANAAPDAVLQILQNLAPRIFLADVGDISSANAEALRIDKTSTGGHIYTIAAGTGTLRALSLGAGSAAGIRISTSNFVRIGSNSDPAAVLHLIAGTAAANTAPLKFTSGTVLGTPEAGTQEYNGRFFLTDTDSVQRHVVQAVASTKTTAGAPYANDGYVDMVINGTTIRFLTTA